MGVNIRIAGMQVGLVLIVLVSLWVMFGGWANEKNAQPEPEAATLIDYDYNDGESNLEVWLERLEVDSRELYRHRKSVIAATGVTDGDIVVDFASGTGVFSLLLAKAIENGGHVYSVDTSSRFLELMLDRALDEDLQNITPVLAPPSAIPLYTEIADFVFISSVYFDFDDRIKAIDNVRRVLKVEGELMIVDFKYDANNQSDPLKNHITYGKNDLIKEVEALGLKFIEERFVDGVTENYLLLFTKPNNESVE